MTLEDTWPLGARPREGWPIWSKELSCLRQSVRSTGRGAEVPAVAEILCQGCGAQRTAAIPVIAGPWLLPPCECGARPQVVRVFSDRRGESIEVADDRRARLRVAV